MNKKLRTFNQNKHRVSNIGRTRILRTAVIALVVAGVVFNFHHASAASPCVTDSTSTGLVTTPVTIAAPPTSTDNNYTVWLYTKGASNSSVGIDIDSGDCIKANLTNTSTTYGWVSMGNNTALTNGDHTMRIVGYAANIFMQKAILINNDCIPSGDASNCATQIVQPPVNTPPTVTVTPPSTIPPAPSTLTLGATAADADGVAKVEFYQNGSLVGTDTSSPYSYTAGNLTAGTYVYTAKVTDSNPTPLSTTSAAVSVIVASTPVSTNTPPLITISAPAPAPAASTNVALTASATDADGIAKVEFYQNGSLLGTDTTSPYSFTTAILSAGTYSFYAKATDNNKTPASTSSAAITITVQNPPTADTTAPTGPSAFNNPSFSYNGWAGACSSATGCSIGLSWPAATDGGSNASGIDHYDVYNGAQKLNNNPITGTSFTDYSATNGGKYVYKVYAVDKVGLRSAGSSTLTRSVDCVPFLWTAVCNLN